MDNNTAQNNFLGVMMTEEELADMVEVKTSYSDPILACWAFQPIFGMDLIIIECFLISGC